MRDYPSACKISTRNLVDLSEKKINREAVLDGVLLKAYRDTVQLPDGGTSVREWIDHPGASAIVPLFKDGTTLLLRQFRYATGREFLEVPAGKLDFAGEAPVDVARRELEEETGYTAENFTHLGKTYPCIGYSNEVIHIFLARDLAKTEMNTETDEFVEPVQLPFEEVVRRARAGEIEDAKSVVSIMMAASFLSY